MYKNIIEIEDSYFNDTVNSAILLMSTINKLVIINTIFYNGYASRGSILKSIN